MSKRKQPNSWLPENSAPTGRSTGRNGAGNPARERQTYYLRADTIQGVKRLAEAHDVGVSRLADFILAHGLEQIEQGELDLPIRQVVTHELEI